MGTRSNVYVETEPGTYLGTYCHYDGYPDHMFPTLQAIDNDTLLSHILVGAPRGGLRGLMDVVGLTEYLDDTVPCVLSNPSEGDYGPDYVYIKCLDGSVKWRGAYDEAAYGWKTELPENQ
tara:strand:- start:221 stop:580 length:360 start_codon:yes stop_codon:yes gene_type:complete